MPLTAYRTWALSELVTPAMLNEQVRDNGNVIILGGGGFLIDGGGSVLATGIARGCLEVSYNCTLTAARLFANAVGSVVIDIWKDTYANYPPTVADTITAAAKPTLSAANKSQDTTLTGWTTALTAGDILYFNVDSVATITWLLVALRVTRT